MNENPLPARAESSSAPESPGAERMNLGQNPAAAVSDTDGSLLVLAILSLVVGAAAGFVGAVFRRSLEQADHWRDALITWAHGEPLIGSLLLTATCATATAIAAWLVHRFSPEASGSGIPNVEGVLNRERPEAPFE